MRDLFEQAHRPAGDRRQTEIVDVRDGAGIFEVRTRAEARPGAGQDDDPDRVVDAELLDQLSERNHDVERHGVHPLRSVEPDDGDCFIRAFDDDERHGFPSQKSSTDPSPGVQWCRWVPVCSCWRANQRSLAARASQS